MSDIVGILVSFLVPCNLRSPEVSVRLRDRKILAAFVTVPKAPMNKDCRTILREDDIRRARQTLVIYTVAEAEAPEN